jgi:acetoin utilization deacetylase AcuC-like enzyme
MRLPSDPAPALLLSHPDCTLHDPPGGHPERPARLAAALAGVRAGAGRLVEQEAPEAAAADLERVHPAAYLEALDAVSATGAWLDADTWAGPGSERAYRRAAGAAVAAVGAVLGGEAGGAFCAVRPPGHHALPAYPMGFCLVNSMAVAVRAAQARGLRRVAVVDWDVHHGNGTQSIFEDDPAVLVVSLHQWPLWPFTGTPDERGVGEGEGATLNVTFPAGTGPGAYLERFAGEALPAVERFGPELVLVSCGFDAHRDDPLGGLELEDETYGTMTAGVVALCQAAGAPPPVILLEGGYDLGAVERGASAVAAALSLESP